MAAPRQGGVPPLVWIILAGLIVIGLAAWWNYGRRDPVPANVQSPAANPGPAMLAPSGSPASSAAAPAVATANSAAASASGSPAAPPTGGSALPASDPDAD